MRREVRGALQLARIVGHLVLFAGGLIVVAPVVYVIGRVKHRLGKSL